MTMLSLTLLQHEPPPVLHRLRLIRARKLVFWVTQVDAFSFFRFVEASEGHSVIDGVDITKIGLSDLQSKLTITPHTSTHDCHSDHHS